MADGDTVVDVLAGLDYEMGRVEAHLRELVRAHARAGERLAGYQERAEWIRERMGEVVTVDEVQELAAVLVDLEANRH